MHLRSHVLALSLFLLIAGNVLAQNESLTWQAGVAKVTITPKNYMWMSGYASRKGPAEGKVHDLWAKALVLQDKQGKSLVLISLDLVGIPRAVSQEICTKLNKKFGLPRESIVLATSHTHCGPVVGRNLRSMYFLDEKNQKLVEDYTAYLPMRVVEAVGKAMKNRKPASVAWGIGKTDFAVNRRTNREAEVPKIRAEGKKLNGPIDHDVPVLAVRDIKSRKLIAVTFGYACHATVMSFNQWFGDYPGFAMLEVEKANPGAVGLFWAGCGADQNPLPRRSLVLARKYGDMLAGAVQDVLKNKMQALPAELQASYDEIPLAFGELPGREQLVKDTMDKNKYVASRARMLLDRLKEKGSLSGTYPYPVQVFRLGKELNLVTLGGEVTVEYALRIKKELEPGKTFVMAYANDVMAYIPSLKVLKEGGYEGASSMIYYGQPTVWSPRVEESVVAEVHRQAAKLQGK